jgi:hypothetical protein
MNARSNEEFFVSDKHEDLIPEVWRAPDGSALSCREKIKVLNENLEELQQMAQDALEDAVIMGADEKQIRQVLERLVASLENPYASS